MEWRLVAGGGGMVVWRLHQIMSVRIVFGGTCDDFELGLRGVHEDNHHHGRSCARAFGFSTENVVSSPVFGQKIKVVPARKTWPPSNAAHEPSVFEQKLCAEPWFLKRKYVSSTYFLAGPPLQGRQFLSKTQGGRCWRPNAVHEPLFLQ